MTLRPHSPWRILWLAFAWMFLISIGMPWTEVVGPGPDGVPIDRAIAPVQFVAYFFAQGDTSGERFALATIVLPVIALTFASAMETRARESHARTFQAALPALVTLAALTWPDTTWILYRWPARLIPILRVLVLTPAVALAFGWLYAARQKLELRPLLGRMLLGHVLMSDAFLFSVSAWRIGLWTALLASSALFVLAPMVPDVSSEKNHKTLSTHARWMLSTSALIWAAGLAYITLSARR